VEAIICVQIKIFGYADKFCGHFVMFPRLFINKNKIYRYKYAKEQAQTKKNFAPVICVFAYLSIPQRNHSLSASMDSLGENNVRVAQIKSNTQEKNTLCNLIHNL
jgi:hypothetical protein